MARLGARVEALLDDQARLRRELAALRAQWEHERQRDRRLADLRRSLSPGEAIYLDDDGVGG